MATDDTTTAGRAGRASSGDRPRRAWRMLRLGIAVTMVAKIAALAWWSGELPTLLGPARAEAIATDTKTTGPAKAERPGDERGGKPDVRALVEAITRRQAELDAREHDIAAREERLRVFEQDVTAKVASLEEIEKRLQARAKSATAAIDAAAESLAKVYGAMKAADAAPILERLDEPTVLTIFGRMKEKQIGEILPLMSKEKAIALTQQLAASAGR